MRMVAEQGKWCVIARRVTRSFARDRLPFIGGREGPEGARCKVPCLTNPGKCDYLVEVTHPAAETGREHAISSPPAPSFPRLPYLSASCCFITNHQPYLSILHLASHPIPIHHYRARHRTRRRTVVEF